MELVSQSEADSYQSCQKKHYFAFGKPIVVMQDGEPVTSRGIAPREHSESLTRGIIGHEGLAKWYESGGDDNAALKIVTEYETGLMNIKYEVLMLLKRYFDVHRYDFDEWEIIAVEREFRYEIPDSDLVFPFKPDMIVRDKRTGVVTVVDHKFLFNYYNPRVFPLMPQLKKYGFALRQMGFRVDGYMYNQISTRKNATAPFKRESFELDSSAQVFMEDQIRVMNRIAHLKNLPNDVWRESAVRNASSFSCSHCPYLDVCAMEVDGDNGVNLHIQTFYGPNSYRYGKDAEE